MNKTKLFYTILFGVIVGSISFAYLKYWNVATVNGRGISRIEYLKNLENQGGKLVLSQMIDEALVLAEGESNKITVEQKVLDEEVSKIESQLKSQGQTLESALVANGMVKDDLYRQIKLKKIQEILSASKVEITQAEIDAFLKENKNYLPTGKTKQELNDLAKEQLKIEADQASASAWLTNLRSSAKIIYK